MQGIDWLREDTIFDGHHSIPQCILHIEWVKQTSSGNVTDLRHVGESYAIL